MNIEPENKEPQNFEVILRDSIFIIRYSTVLCNAAYF